MIKDFLWLILLSKKLPREANLEKIFPQFGFQGNRGSRFLYTLSPHQFVPLSLNIL